MSQTAKRGRDEASTSKESQPALKQTKLTYWLGCKPAVETSNRFEQLENEDQDMEDAQTQKKEPRPPPIFVHGVQQIEPLNELLKSFNKEGKYTIKSQTNGTVKICVNEIQMYRDLLKKLQEKNTDMHSYRPKTERSFRVVLRGVHHSTDVKDIKEALKVLGHDVINVHNIRHARTKLPTPLFYIDLKPDPKNKDIYAVNRLLHYVVKIEPPHPKKEVIQCKRCQRFGHSKSYCNRSPRCVKCDQEHNSSECPRKVRDDCVKCINCGGNHPANYRGCEVHRQLQRQNGQGSSDLRQRIRERRETNEVELDDAVDHITGAIQKAAWSSAPQIDPKTKPPSIPAAVRDLVGHKRELRSRWKTTRHPDDKKKFNKACRELRKLLSEIRNDSINAFMKDLSPSSATDYSLWRAAKKFNRPAITVPPIKAPDGSWARSDIQKAGVFADHLVGVFQPWPDDVPQQSESILAPLAATWDASLWLFGGVPRLIVMCREEFRKPQVFNYIYVPAVRSYQNLRAKLPPIFRKCLKKQFPDT
uniref:Putative nucleic-acid-binding protein from transposon x-element n=1 Tax=Lutzomyia longipalpis TaxID=7200 RepID=A0A1B0GJF1_LUTLO